MKLRRAEAAAMPVVAPTVAVLCGHAPPFAVGAVLAGGLRAATGASVAVVAVLPGSAGEQPPGALLPPLAGARRLAASLRLRGTSAVAAGRLVLARLPESPAAGVAEAHRVVAATGDAPVVLVFAGGRDDAHGPLLESCDHVVAVTGAAVPAALGELARSAGVDHVVGVDVPGLVRGLAATGVPVLGSLRALGEQLGRSGR